MNQRLLALFSFLALLIVLFLFNRKDIELVKQSDIEWEKIAPSGSELNSVIDLYNPNLLSSTVKVIDEKFFINGKYLGELHNEINQGIAGRKETTFPVNVRFSTKDAPDIKCGQKAELKISGEIVFENLFGGGKITVQRTDSVHVGAI